MTGIEDYKDGHGKVIRFVTIVGLVANLLLSGMKFAAGIVGMSQAIVADAVHSLSDCISDLAVIIGSYYWCKPADDGHPYGHRRIETMVTLFVGAMLLMAGVGIIRQAVISLQLHGGAAIKPGGIALAAAFISIFVKEGLFRWTRRVGKKLNSPALVANAWHHRSDAFSSIPALFAVAGSMLMPGWYFLDSLGAIIVSLFVMHAAYQILQPGLIELVDGSAPDEVCQRITKLAESIKGVQQVHGLRTRFSGARLYVDMHVVVDGTISVKEGHDISDDVKGEILNADFGVVDVIVHIEPTDELHI